MESLVHFWHFPFQFLVILLDSKFVNSVVDSKSTGFPTPIISTVEQKTWNQSQSDQYKPQTLNGTGIFTYMNGEFVW